MYSFDYVRVGVKDSSGTYTIKEAKNSSVILATGDLSAGTTSTTFSVKIWLSEDTPNDYQGKDESGNTRNVIFAGKVEIVGSQKVS